MRCNKCGKFNTEAKDICVFCGNKLKEKKIEYSFVQKDGVTKESYNSKNKNKRNAIIYSIYSLPICGIIFLFGYFLYKSAMNSNNDVVWGPLPSIFEGLIAYCIMGIAIIIPIFIFIIAAIMNIANKNNK